MDLDGLHKLGAPFGVPLLLTVSSSRGRVCYISSSDGPRAAEYKTKSSLYCLSKFVMDFDWYASAPTNFGPAGAGK
jgi:hypothetical protein